MVPSGAAECGSDVGLAVLAVDAGGEIALAGHDAGQVPGPDLRGVFAEGPVPDVVKLVLEVPVFTDPGGELGSRGRAGRQAGDQVDPLDCQLACDQAPSPADDLEGLAGLGRRGGSRGARTRRSSAGGFRRGGGPGCARSGPGGCPARAGGGPCRAGRVVLLGDGQVVGSALVQLGSASVLGVQSVRSVHRAGQVDAVQEWGEGRDLVLLPSACL